MTQTVLPTRLYCPFPSQINKFVNIADNHTATWLQRFQLIRDKRHLQYYRQQGFAYMVARMFPTANLKTLCAFSDLNTILFLLDDSFDHNETTEAIVKNKSVVIKSVSNKIISILKSKNLKEDYHPIFAAFQELWTRIIKLSLPAWQLQFIKSMDLIFKAAIWQQNNIYLGKRPKLLEYKAKRQYLGAANIATDTILVANNLSLPHIVLTNPIVKILTKLCRDTVCWANDLFSLSKEIEHGDTHNIVLILEHTYKLNRNDAIIKTIEIHNKQVRQFQKLSHQLPRYNTTIDDQLEKYINGLKAIMKANIDWSDYETTRYQYEYADSYKPAPINALNVVLQ